MNLLKYLRKESFIIKKLQVLGVRALVSVMALVYIGSLT